MKYFAVFWLFFSLTVSFTANADEPYEIEICGVTATDDDGNVAENAIDGNLDTRWSAKADPISQKLEIELCDSIDLSYIDIAWYKGDERSPYFYLQTRASLEDNWLRTSKGDNDILSADFIRYELESQNTRYVRIVGFGNTNNDWVSISELKLFGIVDPTEYDLQPISNLSIINETATRLTLSWTDNSTNEDGYLIEKLSEYSGDYYRAAVTTKTTREFKNLDRNGRHVYRVSPYKGDIVGSGEAIEAQFEFYNQYLTPVSATASSDDGNIANNAFDADLETRWSAYGPGEYITFDLGKEHVLDSVEIAWYKGHLRQANFRVECSYDGEFFYGYEDYEGHVSSGTTDDYELYNFVCDGDDNARYIRIEGFGNTLNDWNSISDIKFIGAVSEVTQ